MRLITIIAVEVTALVLLTCFAAWWAVCPTSVNDNITAHIVSNHSFTNHTVCDRVVSEARQPLSVKALLPGTDLSENFRLVQNDAEQLVEISRISGDIHRRYFVQGNITAAIPTTNRNTAWVLSRIESKLRTLSTLRSLEMRTGALAFDAVKLYHLSESSEAVHLAEQVAVDVGYRLAWLPEQCLVAIAKYPTTALQVCRIQALLEEVSELADHCSAWNPHYRTRRSAKEAADRADKIMTVIKQGYAHEPEPVLQLLRESMRRAGKEPPKVLTPAIDQQTRFSPVSEGTQYAKWFFRV